MISAPTIIASLDQTLESPIVFDVNEEEEHEVFQFVFELNTSEFEYLLPNDDIENTDLYRFREYPKPHLNIVFPPPENRLT